MGFHSILNESLKNTRLKRVRVKTDPSCVADNIDFRNIAGYEGYIISEHNKNIKILVLNPEMSIADVTDDMIEYIANDNTFCQNTVLDDFKSMAKNALVREKNKKENDPVFGNIDNCNSIDDLEVFLKQNGFTELELNDLYRKYITDENI